MAERELSTVAVDRGLVGGPFGSSLVGADYVSTGVPVIRGSNMLGRFIGGDFAYVTPEKFASDLSRNTAAPGDLVFTQRGTLGQVAMVPEGEFNEYVVSQSQMRLRVDKGVADPRFVYFACKRPEFMKQISDNAISTGVPHINLGILGRLTIPDLPIESQQAIAEVLGALDDKVAANKETTELLLGLADAQFAKVVAGSTPGPLTFGEVADIGGGGTPRTTVDEYWGGVVQWATPTDVTALDAPYLAGTARTITEEGLAACSSALYPVGSILMTSRATIGAFAVAKIPTAVNQGFIVVNAKNPAHQWWLFHEMKSRVPEFLSFANGATFLELPRGRFKGLSTRLVSGDAMLEFGRVVGPLHEAAAAFVAESQVLARTRDELLPLLMSGKVHVQDAEKTVEGVL